MDLYFYKYNMTEENSRLILATIVDPKYKRLSFLDDDADVNKYYNFAAKEMDRIFGANLVVISNENDIVHKTEETEHGFFSDEDDATTEKTTLKEIKKYILHPNLNASKFYEEYGKNFHRMQKVAQAYLFSPATSVPVERIFSHASFQVF